MTDNRVYNVVFARRVSSDSKSNNWDLTSDIIGRFTESNPAYALARQKNDQMPDEYSHDFRYLVTEEEHDGPRERHPEPKPEMMTDAWRMNRLDLSSGRLGSYRGTGAPPEVVKELSLWLGKALNTGGEPVLIPSSITIGLLKTHYSEELLKELPPEDYMGYKGVALNSEGALSVLILSAFGGPIQTCAFSYSPRPDFWNMLMQTVPDITRRAEPSAPWAVSVIHPVADVGLAPGCMSWLYPMELALATLYMVWQESRPEARRQF